jgi:hypothetical protein
VFTPDGWRLIAPHEPGIDIRDMRRWRTVGSRDGA